MNNLFQNNGAIFSDCGRYRYQLWRIWDSTKPPVMFIGLNPSTANADTDDPTIRRVVSFASSWGYGGVYMMNLFAWVSAYPEDLLTCVDPIGENDCHLWEVSEICNGEVVFAWGAFKQNKERARQVAEAYPNARCLQKNKDGSPKHPLYVKGDTKLIDFFAPPHKSNPISLAP